MMNILEQEISRHTQIQEQMLLVARQMIKNKRALQKEIQEDMKKPEIKAIIDKLKARNESKYRHL